MGFDLEMKNHLEHKAGNEYKDYYVGDNVVCEAGGKRYIGKITSIGYYRREKDSEPQLAIYIDTTKTKTSYSGEVVMVGDITYLYNGSAAYRQEAVQNLIDIILDYRNSMKEEDQDKVGKMLMGLWKLGTQKEAKCS